MTGASELFQPRRFRWGRDSGHSTAEQSSSSNSRTPGHFGAEISRRRRSALQIPRGARFSPPSVYDNQGTGHVVPVEEAVGEPRIVSLGENERLPGEVLLARARLLERLRGMSLSESRASLGMNTRVAILRDDERVLETNDLTFDNSVWQFNGEPLHDYLMEPTPHLEPPYKFKPPGLSSSEIDLLNSEVFMEQERSDCSICQESFSHGDKLVNLPCEHRYHFTCLEPWIRACGDCPNCRRIISSGP